MKKVKERKLRKRGGPSAKEETRTISPTEGVTAIGVSRQRKCWETFFYEQKSPILRSQMLTILMAGSTLETARIPIPALLDAVLVAYVARNYCGAEVVDDYAALIDRIKEYWERPDWTSKVFSSLHVSAAAFIVFQGESSLSCVEDQYIPAMVQWYLGHDAPIYFDREMTEQEMERHWGLVGKSPPPKRRGKRTA